MNDEALSPLLPVLSPIIAGIVIFSVIIAIYKISAICRQKEESTEPMKLRNVMARVMVGFSVFLLVNSIVCFYAILFNYIDNSNGFNWWIPGSLVILSIVFQIVGAIWEHG